MPHKTRAGLGRQNKTNLWIRGFSPYSTEIGAYLPQQELFRSPCACEPQNDRCRRPTVGRPPLPQDAHLKNGRHPWPQRAKPASLHLKTSISGPRHSHQDRKKHTSRLCQGQGKMPSKKSGHLAQTSSHEVGRSHHRSSKRKHSGPPLGAGADRPDWCGRGSWEVSESCRIQGHWSTHCTWPIEGL